MFTFAPKMADFLLVRVFVHTPPRNHPRYPQSETRINLGCWLWLSRTCDAECSTGSAQTDPGTGLTRI